MKQRIENVDDHMGNENKLMTIRRFARVESMTLIQFL